MKRNFYSYILLLFFLILLISSCKKSFTNRDARKLLLNTIYPQKITADYNIVTRYETKDEPYKWKDEPWKVNNNILEKAGLIRQQILDTTIEFYIEKQARFENRHQYLYKVILSNVIKSLMTDVVRHSIKFNEWDYYNKNTGRKDWLDCKVTCGEIKLDSIINFELSKSETEVSIEYKEKYYPSPFNNIVYYGKKYHANDIFYRTIRAHKYPGEDWIISY
jgi:hypothetical protein